MRSDTNSKGMTETMSSLIWAAAATGMTGMVCLSGLRAWRGWLDLRRYELAASRAAPEPGEGSPGVRIELADLRERLRKLEAIATGVDL